MSAQHSRPFRTCALLAAIVLAGTIAPPAFSDDGPAHVPDGDRGAAFRADIEFAHFEGDYGSGETIRFDALTTRLRWRWSRAELRVGLPLLRLDGQATLVGGAPASLGAGNPGGGPASPGRAGAPSATVASDGRSASGAGDIVVRADYDLLLGSTTRPWLTGVAAVKLPTADEAEGLGTGEADVEGGLQLVQPLGTFSLFAEGRYRRIGDPPGLDLDDVVRTGVGVSRRVRTGTGSLVYAFWENRTHPVPGRADRRDVMLGGSTRLGTEQRVRLAGAVYAGLSETAEDWGVHVTLGREF